MDSSRVKKADVIAHALKSCDITDLSSVVMVGDREHDVLGAAHFSIDSIGVLYGYGDREELSAAGATYIATTVADVLNFIE
jgi:phosphoglycolate phosphatase